MLSVENHTGRLVEVEVRSPVTGQEIAASDAAMQEVWQKLGRKAVICADYVHTTVLGETEAQALIAMFRRHNEHLERSAVLVSEQSAVAILQMERVIREAQLPTRRAFRDARALLDWLSEALSPREQERARFFLLRHP